MHPDCGVLYMVYINIPYVIENERIDRSVTIKELELLNISETAKHDVFNAIYYKRPRGVDIEDRKQAVELQEVLSRLGIPYRPSNESEYKYDARQ